MTTRQSAPTLDAPIAPWAFGGPASMPGAPRPAALTGSRFPDSRSPGSIIVLNDDRPHSIAADHPTLSRPIHAGVVRNAFTIDVEDWFQIAGFADVIDPDSWSQLPGRISRNVTLLLRLLIRHDVKATFFVSGWVADRYPQLVRDIAGLGHEVASRGYEHRHIAEHGPASFRDNLICAKALLENLIGKSVIGYRAPDFSLMSDTPWAHEIIAETGHRYSSSVFPIFHDRYGLPGAPRFPYAPHPGLLEIPPSTVTAFGQTLPATGGGYFRLYPYRLSAWAVRRINRLENAPVVFYAHPWSVDVRQPRVRQATLVTRLRHYTNLDRTLMRLDRLLTDFHWGTMIDVFGDRIDASSTTAGGA